jgi:phenylalanine-4-hydroxylase
MKDFNNPQVAALPAHLRQYIAEQHYDRYTPVDHAVWRYVMRQNYHCLKDMAYYPYIPGLKAAGLTIEKIPRLQEMNDALGKIGWGAVTVDGFIPPSAFMEFQACRVLVIAAGIRTLAHIAYTPAPDIIHESAGHAPIIADPEYNRYLSYFGAIGTKAMFSAQDFELYEAIRALSALKEMPGADLEDIREAEAFVARNQQHIGEPSEMALLSRLHWWTVEYGLIGTPENPKIYGAGLLSSIGESVSCMQPDIKKLPYTIDAINYPYDITRPQPQLFVTPTFQNLVDVLEEFADTMAFRRGGTYGMEKALESKNTCTAVYSSGLQVSGNFLDFEVFKGQPAFIRTAGPTTLSYNGQQLKDHGKDDHHVGFSSPVGKLKNIPDPLEYRFIEPCKHLHLHFESGMVVMGLVSGILREQGRNLLITFIDCTVMNRRGDIIFDPSWGAYDMAVGEKIVSVFCGAGDKAAFEERPHAPGRQSRQLPYDLPTLRLHRIYRQVREARQNKSGLEYLKTLWESLEKEHPGDWLCALEILELAKQTALAAGITHFLEQKAMEQPEFKRLIRDGLNLIEHEPDIREIPSSTCAPEIK